MKGSMKRVGNLNIRCGGSYSLSETHCHMTSVTPTTCLHFAINWKKHYLQ